MGDDVRVGTLVTTLENLVDIALMRYSFNPFFDGLEPYRDIKNEGIEIHIATPSDGRFKVTNQFASKQVLIDTLYKDALENGYQFKVSSSNKKRWDIKCVHKQCKWKT